MHGAAARFVRSMGPCMRHQACTLHLHGLSLTQACCTCLYTCSYNTVMKIVYLGTSFAILYFMRFHKVVKCTYDREQDAFRYQFLVLPCLVLAFLLPNAWTPFEVCCRAPAHHWAGSSSSSTACFVPQTACSQGWQTFQAGAGHCTM